MGTLYVIATPIGNLNDLSPRAIDTLRNSDLVLVEEEYAIAINKNNTSLKESLDEFINKIKMDGTLESIVGVYYE